MANEARENVMGDFTEYLREQLRDPAMAVEYIKASCENDLSLSEAEFNKSIEMALFDIANAHESAIRTAAAALEQVCRNTGHVYFNRRQTGRRLFWTEAGWSGKKEL